MNRIIIEGQELANAQLQANDIDDAIDKLRELKATQKREDWHTLQRFNGIVKPTENSETGEEEWYLQ
ncbi:MAG: hypothetical protein AB1656_03880 [Candidatus Omnitrophota bacterium]